MTHQWLDRTEYPFRSNYFTINSHQLHYIDEGEGDILLFVHGTPSWSFDFRNIIKKLRNRYRCIAIDHMGFGLSDKPQDYDYSTQNHSSTLQQFIQAKKLDTFTLLVHDFGGPIGLNVAIQHPEWVDNLVVMNSWLWSSEQDPEFIKLSKILRSPLLPFLYRYLNFSPKFILPRSFGDSKLSGKLLRQYTKPFKNRTERNGALAFARSLLNDQGWFEELWNNRYVISDKPVLFIWGMKDPVISPNYLDKFSAAFKTKQVVRLETCGHFPQEEQPEQVTKDILDFLK